MKPIDIAQAAPLSIRELNALAVTGLSNMLDPDKQMFCYRFKRTAQGMTREGLSYRYTLMVLLGLHRLETTGDSSPIRVDTLLNVVFRNSASVKDIGELGLLLWLCAVAAPERLEAVYAQFDVQHALERFREAHEARTMELAWFLAGLSHAALAGDQPAHLAHVALKTFELLKKNQGPHGIFGHLSRTESWSGLVRGRVGSFADQVYPIYALVKFGHVYQIPSALQMARGCALAICQAQGRLGQWWWHYDALTGRVLERYPVYAVHQHGMAPMALFALGDAAGVDFRESIYKGLAWVTGTNELQVDLRDTTSSLVWRSIYRRPSYKAYLAKLCEYLSPFENGRKRDGLTINSECRPYELGWLLYAFAGRDHD